MSRTRKRKRRSRGWRANGRTWFPREQLIDRDEYGLAAECLRKQISVSPSDQQKRLLAICLCKLSDYAGSLEAIRSIVPPLFEDHVHAGICLLDLQQWDEAVREFQSAPRIPNPAHAYYWCAVAAAQGSALDHR